MTIDTKLLARAARAFADVLDPPSVGGPARAAATSTQRSAPTTREAFAARFGGKRCETCGNPIAQGALVFWGHERGQLRHAECAGASAPATAAEPAPAPLRSPHAAATPADDFGASFDGGGGDEIPF